MGWVAIVILEVRNSFLGKKASYLANQELSSLIGLASLHRENGYSISTQYQHYAGNSSFFVTSSQPASCPLFYSSMSQNETTHNLCFESKPLICFFHFISLS
jgi:hypothetical protein